MPTKHPVTVKTIADLVEAQRLHLKVLSNIATRHFRNKEYAKADRVTAQMGHDALEALTDLQMFIENGTYRTKYWGAPDAAGKATTLELTPKVITQRANALHDSVLKA